MKSQHRLITSHDPESTRQLRVLGFDEVTDSTHFLDLWEDDPRWPQVQAILAAYPPISHRSFSYFSQQEKAAASWLVNTAVMSWGYPQPEEGYFEQTYDPASYCPKCWTGTVQRAPFRFSREPGWGTRQMLMLNWVRKEYFVQPGLWERVFQPLGIGCRPVLHHRTGKELTTVVQLKIDTVLNGPLDLEGYPYTTCPLCHRRIYQSISSGRFPRMTVLPPPQIHLVKSQEFFGSGQAIYQQVFFSQTLYQGLLREKVKALDFMPVAE